MKQPPMPTKVQAEILQLLVDGWALEFGQYRTIILNPHTWGPVWRNVSNRTVEILGANGWTHGEIISFEGREALARYHQKEARRADR